MRPSATRASSNLNTPEIMQGLPGSNGLSSPPIVYKNLVITGGKRRRIRPGDLRATCARGTCTPASWSWTFRSVPRAGEKYNDTWAGDSWKNRSGVNVWGFMTVDVAARHRLHAVRRAVGRSVRRRPRGRQPVRHQPRRGRCEYREVSVALPGRASRHLGRRSRGRAGAHRREAGRPDDSRRCGDRQGGPAVPARSRDRQADLWRRGAAGAAKRGAARTNVEDAAVPAQAAAALAHDDVGGGHRDGHARARSGVQEAHRGHAARRTVSAGLVQPPARAVPRQPRRRQLGRDVVQSATGLSVRQHERARADLRPQGSRSERDRRGAGRGSGQPRPSGRPVSRACRAAGASRTTPRT